VAIHLELNTGLNRLGINEDELATYLDFLAKHPKLQLEGVMTHLANADGLKDDFTTKQVEAFDRQVGLILDEGFKPTFVHIAQTAGSLKAKSRYSNAVRLGIGLYGINPLDPKDSFYKRLSKLKPVLELRTTIIKTIDLKRGDKVGYGCSFSAPRKMTIAVLPVGYHDGLPRLLSGKAVLTSGEHRLRIVGRIYMNMTTVEVSGTGLGVGDHVTVISPDPAEPNSVASLTRDFQIFSYELLVHLASTTRRKIISD
jgi:alanine racemase